MERVGDRGILIGGVLEFQNRQRQAVDEQHHIGPAIVLPLDHRELIDREPVVRLGRLEVDQPHTVPSNRAIGPLVFHSTPSMSIRCIA